MTYYIADSFLVRNGERSNVDVPDRIATFIENAESGTLPKSGWYTDGRSNQYGTLPNNGWMHASETPNGNWFTEDGYYFTVLDFDNDVWATAHLTGM